MVQTKYHDGHSLRVCSYGINLFDAMRILDVQPHVSTYHLWQLIRTFIEDDITEREKKQYGLYVYSCIDLPGSEGIFLSVPLLITVLEYLRTACKEHCTMQKKGMLESDYITAWEYLVGYPNCMLAYKHCMDWWETKSIILDYESTWSPVVSFFLDL